MLHQWLVEAEQHGLLKEGLNLREIADFLVIALNGASSMYAASKDPPVWRQTLAQLRAYLGQLENRKAQSSTKTEGGVQWNTPMFWWKNGIASASSP